MCATCGCAASTPRVRPVAKAGAAVRYRPVDRAGALLQRRGGHAPPRSALADVDPQRRAGNGQGAIVALERDVLAKNDALARDNRAGFERRGILALNLMSSPGSGKTTLLVRTVRDLGATLPIAVLGGDQATDNDASRIAAAGCAVHQINTGAGCHLDAAMVARALPRLAPPERSVLMIENVGNLVCPALFDLGEAARVVMLSVTEGEDKPLKYPHMFRSADLMLLTKIDLLPHLDFDVERCLACARRIRPGVEVLALSARSGEGLEAWYGWLRARHDAPHPVLA